MATFTPINKHAAAVGTAYAVNYLVPALTASYIIGGTIANLLSDPVRVTVTVNDGSTDTLRINAVYLNPGATMNPMGDEKWTLLAGYTLKVKSDTAASLDCMFDGVEVS